MAMTRELRCPLTEEQLKAKASALAQAVEDRKKKKAAWKNHASTARAEIKEIDERIHSLTRDYQEKSESRMVPCEEVHDHKASEVQIIRADTQEIIDSRPMTAEEKKIPKVPNPAAKGKK